jgi:hypothetical protein
MNARLLDPRHATRSCLAWFTILAISAVTLLFAASPAAAQDYVRNSSISYDLRDGFGRPHPTCRGFAFIGQTVSNTIEAYSTVRCSGNGIMPAASVTTFIKREPQTLNYVAQKLDNCVDCRYVVASVNTPGAAPGSRFCVQGSGHFFAAIQGNGSGTTCIVT